MKNIGEYAFYGCSGLTELFIPGSVTDIGPYAFAYTGLTSLTIPESVTIIKEGVFLDCSGLTELTIPNSVTSIDKFAFSYIIGLTSLTIPESVTDIGIAAFRDCSGLTSLTIGNSVTSLGELAFYGCDDIKDVTFLTKKPFAISSDVFSCQDKATLHVQKDLIPTFGELEGWKDFSSIKDASDPDDEDPAKIMDTNRDGDVNSADVVRIYNYIITGE